MQSKRTSMIWIIIFEHVLVTSDLVLYQIIRKKLLRNQWSILSILNDRSTCKEPTLLCMTRASSSCCPFIDIFLSWCVQCAIGWKKQMQTFIYTNKNHGISWSLITDLAQAQKYKSNLKHIHIHLTCTGLLSPHSIPLQCKLLYFVHFLRWINGSHTFSGWWTKNLNKYAFGNGLSILLFQVKIAIFA